MKINVSKLIGTRATLKLPISTYQVQVSLKGAEFAGTKVSMWVQLRVVAMLANEAAGDLKLPSILIQPSVQEHHKCLVHTSSSILIGSPRQSDQDRH